MAGEAARQRKVGSPWSEDTEQGPQVDRAQFDKILQYIRSGSQQGAELVAGGERHGDRGYFIQPTVFSQVEDHMTIAKEEIFGPVQCILKFKTLDEAIERANKTSYGLAAGILTKDINNANQFAQSILAGSVWVNCYDHKSPHIHSIKSIDQFFQCLK